MPNLATTRDGAAEYRADFVAVVGRLGLNSQGAIRLVEAVTGQPFESCGPVELRPLIRELIAIAHRLREAGARPCHG